MWLQSVEQQSHIVVIEYKCSKEKTCNAAMHVVLCMWFCFFFSVGVSRSKVIQVEFKRFPHKARFESREVQGSWLNHVEHTNNTNYPDFRPEHSQSLVTCKTWRTGSQAIALFQSIRQSCCWILGHGCTSVRWSLRFCFMHSIPSFIAHHYTITPQLVDIACFFSHVYIAKP